jgi:hypothetical protein
MKLSAMKIDPALSEQGDWVENIPDLPGIRIKARGTNNSDYRALEAKLVREIPRAERIEGVSPQEQDRIAGRLLLETVVLDVEGLEDDDNKPLAYTRELGAQLLLDPEFGPMQDRSSRSAARSTRSSTQNTDRRPGLAARLGRDVRHHRCGGAIRRRAAADAAMCGDPHRSALAFIARMGSLRAALDRSAGRADAGRDSLVVD